MSGILRPSAEASAGTASKRDSRLRTAGRETHCAPQSPRALRLRYSYGGTQYPPNPCADTHIPAFRIYPHAHPKRKYPNHRNHVNYIECCPQKRSCNCKVKYRSKDQALIKGRHLKRPFLTTFGTLTHSSFFGPNWWRCQDFIRKKDFMFRLKEIYRVSSRYCIRPYPSLLASPIFIRHVACSFLCLNILR